MRKLLLLILLSDFLTGFSQGDIDYIKNQEYLRLRDKVHCNDSADDNLSEKICANLSFQKSDSLLTFVYKAFLKKANHSDSLTKQIIQMQKTWRHFRDQHCRILYDSYEGCGGCHQRSIDWLNCLTDLTDTRTRELKSLTNQIFGQ